MQQILFPDVNGAGISIYEAPGFGQNSFHHNIQVLHPAQINTQGGQGIQFLLFADHGNSFYTMVFDFVCEDSRLIFFLKYNLFGSKFKYRNLKSEKALRMFP